MTDHSKYIAALRDHNSTTSSLAADLLEMHDRTSLSLDDWTDAQQFICDVLSYIEADGGYELQKNGA